MRQTDCLQGVGGPHKCAHAKSDDKVAGVEVRDDALVEDEKHDQRRRQKAHVEQFEHRNGVERVLHGRKGVAPDDCHRKQQDFPEQRRASAGAAGGAARAQVLASNRAIGHHFDIVSGMLGHRASSRSIWAWCPHAHGCVPPHGQIKAGRTGPPARPATVATTKQPVQFTTLKHRVGRSRCSDSVYVAELNQFG